MAALFPAWITRDAAIIIASRAFHTFSQGLLAVMLAVYLREQLGLAVFLVGLFFSLGFASTAAFSFLSTFVSERVGRRKLMVSYSLITLAGSAGLAVSSNPAALVTFAFIGSFNGAAGNVGPTQSLEQAAIAGVVEPSRRTELFALYRVAAATAGALGALAAGLPIALQSLEGVSEPASFRIVLWGLVGLRLVITLLFMLLSDKVEAEQGRREWVNPLRLPSSGRIFTLSGLFSMDQLAGAIIVRGLLALWFSERFGLDLASLGVLFFVAQVVGVASLWVAGKLANRIGLINTMSLAHLPSGLLLIAGHRVLAVGVAGGGAAAVPVAVRPDRRARAGLLHHVRGAAARAGGDGKHPHRGALHLRHHRADALHGSPAGDRAQRPARRLRAGEDHVRLFALLHVQECEGPAGDASERTPRGRVGDAGQGAGVGSMGASMMFGSPTPDITPSHSTAPAPRVDVCRLCLICPADVTQYSATIPSRGFSGIWGSRLTSNRKSLTSMPSSVVFPRSV